MKKIILIMLGIVFLSGCSGVSRFSVTEFANGVKKICSEDNRPQLNIISIHAESTPTVTVTVKSTTINNHTAIVDGLIKGVEATSKTGCSANITPTNCSVSCGGSDTPKIVSNTQQQKSK